MNHLAKRIWLALALLGALHFTAAAASATPTLSGANVFDGYYGGYNAYPESQPCGSFHLYFIEGTDPNGTIVNDNTPLSLNLTPGTHTFTLLGTEGPNTSQINFGDPSSLPAVTLNLSDGAASGSLTIAHGSSGSLVLGTNTVSVTSFSWTPYDQSSVNRVGTCGVGGDSWYDAIGQLTIEVSPPPPVLTQIQVLGPPGGWLTQPNGDGGIFNLYLYDQHGAILNPDGLVNYALPDGTYTLTLRATDRADGPVFYLNIWLNGNYSGPVDIAVSTASPLGSAVLGGKSVTVTSFTWLNGGQPDMVSVDYPAQPDGYSDSVGEFTIEVSTYAIQNQPPMANAGPDQTVEGTGPLTSVTLNGTASADPDGDALSYSWSENGIAVSAEINPTLSLAQGLHTFTLAVDDGQGGSADDAVLIEVVDTTAPTIILNGNDAMRVVFQSTYVDPGVTLTDLCDPNPVLTITGAVNTSALGTYTISYQGEDNRGNLSAVLTRTVEVYKTPTQLTGDLVVQINSLITSGAIPAGNGTAFNASLNAALASLSAGNTADAIGQLKAFINKVKAQSGKKVSKALATQLIEEAHQLITQLGGVAKLAGRPAPTRFALNANYPNPFNPSTTLRYNLVEAGQVQLTVYNAMGQQIRVLVDQQQQAGTYHVEWDSRDQSGQDVAPGLYLYRLVSGNQTAHGKMLLVK